MALRGTAQSYFWSQWRGISRPRRGLLWKRLWKPVLSSQNSRSQLL